MCWFRIMEMFVSQTCPWFNKSHRAKKEQCWKNWRNWNQEQLKDDLGQDLEVTTDTSDNIRWMKVTKDANKQ